MGLALDTSTLIGLLSGSRKIRSAIADQEALGLVPVLSTVVAFEALSGVEFTRSKAERARLESLIRHLPLEDFTLEAARVAGELRADLRRVGRSPIAPPAII